MLKTVDKELANCLHLCDRKEMLANSSYFMVEEHLKKIDRTIKILEQELIAHKLNDFSYQNSILDRDMDELLNFENFLTKKSKTKKNKNILKRLNLSIKEAAKSKVIYLLENHKKLSFATKNHGKRGTIKQTQSKEKSRMILNDTSLEDITYKELDGKLDPKEPIYCFCNYVSFGNMVKCDNSKVAMILMYSAQRNGSIFLV